MKKPEEIIRSSITNTLTEIEDGHRKLGLPPDGEDVDEALELIERIDRRIREERARQWFAARWERFKALVR